MIDDTDLDDDAKQALADGRTVAREVRRDDGRVYIRKVEPYHSDLGGVIVTYEPCDLPDESGAAHDRIIQSLAAGIAQIGIWIFDPQTEEAFWDERSARVTGLEKLPAPLSEATFADHIASRDRTGFRNAVDAAIHKGVPLDLELRFIPPSGKAMWLRMRGERAMHGDKPVLICIVADVSEAEANKTRSEFMMRELDHRVNNLLAIILSIAEISARSNTDLKTYAKDFRGRLESMARTHSLLAHTQWSGPPLRALIETEINAHCTTGAIHLNGPEITLSPSAAQSLAMFFHELSANAAKHGALSNNGSDSRGRVDVSWSITSEEEPMLELHWRESGGPAVAQPVHDGFGDKVINRIIAKQLHADVSTQWKETGICLTARVPLAKISQQRAA